MTLTELEALEALTQAQIEKRDRLRAGIVKTSGHSGEEIVKQMLAARAAAETGAVTEITTTDVDELTAFFLSLNDIDKSKCRSIDDPTIWDDV